MTIITCKGYCEKTQQNNAAYIVFPKTRKATFFNVNSWAQWQNSFFSTESETIMLSWITSPTWNVETKLYDFPPAIRICIKSRISGEEMSTMFQGEKQIKQFFHRPLKEYKARTIVKRIYSYLMEG